MMTRMLAFTFVSGLLLAGCNNDRDLSVETVPDECRDLVSKRLIGQNGPEVCITTPLSKSDTTISGTIVGGASPGPFLVTALNGDGGIVREVSTLASGDFTMSQLNLQNMPGKGITFSVTVNGKKSPSTNLVVGQEPPANCGEGAPGHPLCGTHPGAIFFPVKTSITAIIAVPAGERYGGATLYPQFMGLGRMNWRPNRTIAFFLTLHPPLVPGDKTTVYAENLNHEVFTYPVETTVLPTKD